MESQKEAGSKVVLDVYQDAERYCKASTCRRKFIVEDFGEMCAYHNCGNCDNCSRSNEVHERDMSEETHMLLSAIELCGGRFGINVPIGVLCGSRAKKILKNKFDELPLYGLGSSKSPNWWKSLGDELLAIGYLMETRHNVYRLVSISTFGKKFLQAAFSQRLPVMLIPNHEMLEEESQIGNIANNKVFPYDNKETTLNFLVQSMSEPEMKLYESLLKNRENLAKKHCTAPYAICSELTLQNLAKVRPSNKAFLLNVDGVNQWLAGKHGNEILKTIKKLSAELGLPLNNSENLQIESQRVPNSTTSYRVPHAKATPASVKAWRMWQDLGMGISEIANLPHRPRPIRDDTVAGYIMDCCRLGYELDWERFSNEIGFSKEILTEVQAGVERAGTRNKLKPIKEQVPIHVSYLHIRAFLMMEDLELPHPSAVGNRSNQNENWPNLGKASTEHGDSAGKHRAGAFAKPKVEEELPWMDKSSSLPLKRRREPMWIGDSNKVTKRARSKQIEDVKPFQQLSLTDDTFLHWLSEQDGVSIKKMLSVFVTDRKSLLALLTELEEEFLIYKRNDLYRII